MLLDGCVGLTLFKKPDWFPATGATCLEEGGVEYFGLVFACGDFVFCVAGLGLLAGH